MDKLLLIIESPGKREKITKYCKELGVDAVVKASLGHIRELANAGEDDRGFDIDGTKIVSQWAVSTDKKKNLSAIRQEMKGRKVILATDGDREGESIAWHLMEELKLKNPDRVVYHEITKDAIKKALASPRKLDFNLVGAALGRAHLDKMVGYSGTKRIVWALDIGAKSMGRVQSSALWLLVSLELRIRAFKPEDYFSLSVAYPEGFKALYCATKSTAEETAVGTVSEEQETKEVESDRITDPKVAAAIVQEAQSHPHKVIKLERQQATLNAPAPFTTSSLQQAAGALLKLAPERTMELAQVLYEQGLITYMRTDSVNLAESFCAAALAFLQKTDPNNVPAKTAKHKSKDGAQEAHEAIRPTDPGMTPEKAQATADTPFQKLKGQGKAEALKLYDLIWRRAIATQTAPARVDKTRVLLQSGSTHWEVRGQVLIFPGYTQYWNNLSSDAVLPTLTEEQVMASAKLQADKKRTSPPVRFSEPRLIQEMEKKGIGRPSTYASTIKTLKDRQYVEVEKGKLVVTPMGMELMAFLDTVIPNLVRPKFTAEMESQLDQIASGKLQWQTFLVDFYTQTFAPALSQAEAAIAQLKQQRKPK